MKTLLGFDIGGTKCAVLLGTLENDNISILCKETIATDKKESPYAIIEKLCCYADKMVADHKPDAIGISCGGPLDSAKGIVMSPPNLPLWDNFPVCEILSNRYKVPAKLQNDANACAVAENRLGAGKGTKNMVFMTFGTGLGAGLIINGKLLEGANGNAGEIGHIRLCDSGPIGYGKSGSFEGFCSGGGLAQLGFSMCKEALKNGKTLPYFIPDKELGGLTAKILADAAFNGDETAIQVYIKCGEYLGKGLSILIDILNPEKIVIGSIFERAGELLIPSMNEVIKREALSNSASVCEIVPAKLGDKIGDYAALITATT